MTKLTHYMKVVVQVYYKVVVCTCMTTFWYTCMTTMLYISGRLPFPLYGPLAHWQNGDISATRFHLPEKEVQLYKQQ